MSIPSPITWFGGKSRLAPKIIQHFPKHQCYTEPFGGSAAVLLAKEPSPIEVFNDLDGELVNFFRVLRDPRLSARLRSSLERTPYARAEFELAQQPTDDAVEAARRFMVRQRQSFAGKGSEWSFSVAKSQGGVSSAVMRWRAGIERLPAVHERLRNVQIEHDDWWKVVSRYDGPETLYFIDPPYLRSLRVEGGYRHELSDSDHRELVARLLTVKGMVILCAYNHVKIHGPLERAGWKKWITMWLHKARTVGRAGWKPCGYLRRYRFMRRIGRGRAYHQWRRCGKGRTSYIACESHPPRERYWGPSPDSAGRSRNRQWQGSHERSSAALNTCAENIGTCSHDLLPLGPRTNKSCFLAAPECTPVQEMVPGRR